MPVATEAAQSVKRPRDEDRVCAFPLRHAGLAALAVWAVVRERLPATVSAADLHKALTPPTMDGTHPCVFATVAQGKVEVSQF
jgi:hypothetical protein